MSTVQAALARDVGGEVDRKSEGVVEAKRVGAGDALAAAPSSRSRSNTFMPCSSVSAKRSSSALQRLLDHRVLRREFGIRLAHLARRAARPVLRRTAASAELVAVPDRAADDPAQHVAAAFVRRQHAVDDEEAARADVVGDHAQRCFRDRSCSVQLRRGLDQVLEEIDLVVRMHVLQHGREALEAHAGIDAGFGSFDSVPSAARSNCMNTRFQISM